MKNLNIVHLVKDWKIVTKMQNWSIPKIDRFALCKFSTKRWQSGSHFAQSDQMLTKLVFIALQLQMVRSQEAPMFQISRNLRKYGISKPWAKSPPPLWLIGLNTLSWTMNFDDTLSVIALNKWNGGIIEPTLICLIHFFMKLVYR